MDWKGLKNVCFRVDIEEIEDATLASELIEFWREYASVVVKKNREEGIGWNYLYVSVRGPDGFIHVWPQTSGEEPKEAYFAALLVYRLADAFDTFSEAELETKGQALKRKIAEMFVTAAESVHLDELAGDFPEGLPIRFHTYDDEEPFHTAVIGGKAEAQAE